MAGTRQGNFARPVRATVRAAAGAALAAALIAGVAAVTAAQAQVPLPQPNPQSRTGNVPPPPGANRPAPAPAPQSRNTSPSWLPSIFGGQKQEQPPATTTTFEPRHRVLVDKVSAYLSSVHVLSGDFIQVAADGRRAKGQFYIQKPGRVRFEYEPPSPIDIVSDGSSVV